MFPIFLNLGPITIYSYGLSLALAVFIGTFVIWRSAKKLGYPDDKILDLILVGLISALVVAHAFFIIFNGPFSIISLLSFWQDGRLFYGALLGGSAAIYYMCRKNRWSPFEVGDIVVVGVTLGQAIGSFGCVLSGCNQPTQLIEIFFFLALYALMVYLVKSKKLFSGFLLFLYLGTFSSFRFVIESFRDQSLLINYILSFAIFVVAVIGFYRRRQSYLVGAAVNLFKKEELEIVPKKRVVLTWRELSMQKKLPTNFLNKMKNRLLKKEEKLTHEQMRLEQEDPFRQEGREDDNAERVDDTQEQIGHESVQTLKQVLKKSLNGVQKSLERIRRGKYGICEICGKAIDKARLEAFPSATLCIECERRKEQTASPKETPPTERIS